MPSTSPMMHSRRTASVSPIQEKTAAKHEHMHLGKPNQSKSATYQSHPAFAFALLRTLTSANVPHNKNNTAAAGQEAGEDEANVSKMA